VLVLVLACFIGILLGVAQNHKFLARANKTFLAALAIPSTGAAGHFNAARIFAIT
jgi:hypothetical protein